MKKSILFVMPSMYIGGAERSLLGLLGQLDYERYDVSLFLYRHDGEFLHLIPLQVHVLAPMEQYKTFDVPIKSLLLSSKFPFGAARILSKAAAKLHCAVTGERQGVWMSMQYTSCYLQPLLPAIPGHYDLAVMFLGVADTILNKVHAKHKVAWCHTTYDSLFPDKKKDVNLYRQLDRVVCVSPSCREKMLSFYPQLKEKVITVENILSADLLHEQAKEPAPDMIRSSDIMLLSIGRFSDAKNFDNVPDICRRLLADGLDVKWYLIGYGGDEALIRRRIAEAGMEDRVIILGKKDNPYPYIAACDLYVQPSRYEGKCVTVREAQMLGKSVVITNYATSASQLENGVDGVVVPMDNQGCAAGIAALLRNPEKMERLAAACRARDYSNAQEVEKIYQLMED